MCVLNEVKRRRCTGYAQTCLLSFQGFLDPHQGKTIWKRLRFSHVHVSQDGEVRLPWIASVFEVKSPSLILRGLLLPTWKNVPTELPNGRYGHCAWGNTRRASHLAKLPHTEKETDPGPICICYFGNPTKATTTRHEAAEAATEIEAATRASPVFGGGTPGGTRDPTTSLTSSALTPACIASLSTISSGCDASGGELCRGVGDPVALTATRPAGLPRSGVRLWMGKGRARKNSFCMCSDSPTLLRRGPAMSSRYLPPSLPQVSVKGKPSAVSLLQMATYTGHCALVRLRLFGDAPMPSTLVDVLSDLHVLKVGVGCFEDGKRLAHDHGLVLRCTVDLRFLAQRQRYLNHLMKHFLFMKHVLLHLNRLLLNWLSSLDEPRAYIKEGSGVAFLTSYFQGSHCLNYSGPQ